MGILEFGFFVIIAAVLGYVITVVLDWLAPGHPPVLNHLVWALVVLAVVVRFLSLLGAYAKV
jgi:hypothetical protein